MAVTRVGLGGSVTAYVGFTDKTPETIHSATADVTVMVRPDVTTVLVRALA